MGDFVFLCVVNAYSVGRTKRQGLRMRQNKYRRYLLLIGIAAICNSILIGQIRERSALNELDMAVVKEETFRNHVLNEEMIMYMQKSDVPAKAAGIFMAEEISASCGLHKPYTTKKIQKAEHKWRQNPMFDEYMDVCDSIWRDLKYFPVPKSATDDSLTVSYGDSWMGERTFGGRRGHEGTDLMANENIPGLYPIISMTDGVVVNKGWLPKGGWRIGILSPSGGYYYYAHLSDYADIEEGDEIKAGELLGYMGDSGYGEEGTTGMFPVHLHVGIYIYPDGKEISINPYWIMRYLEKFKLEAAYS